ncbi:hypothetical protein ABZ752_22795 [Streptomyces roseifaciens]
MDPTEYVVTRAGQPWAPAPHARPLDLYKAPAPPAVHDAQATPAPHIDPHTLAAIIAAAQQPPAPMPADPSRASGRAKDVALIAVGGGIGIGTAGVGVGYASGMVATNAGGLMTAAIAIALAVGAVTVAVLMLKNAFAPGPARDHATETTAHQPVPQTVNVTHITQQVNANGLFSRAYGTDPHQL